MPVGGGIEHDEFHLWPENVPTWLMWQQVQTQWRPGFAGPTGLDYMAIDAAHLQPGQCRRLRRTRGRLLGELQVMERSALAAWEKRRELERAQQRKG